MKKRGDNAMKLIKSKIHHDHNGDFLLTKKNKLFKYFESIKGN